MNRAPARSTLSCQRAARRLGGDPEEDLGLDRIGVLEFVDEDVAVASPERAPHGVVLAHERARLFQQIVEVEDGGGALERGIVGKHLVELVGEMATKRGGDAAEQDAVAVIDAREMTRSASSLSCAPRSLPATFSQAVLRRGVSRSKLWRRMHVKLRRMGELPERRENRAATRRSRR